MDTKHTPGPWQYVRNGRERNINDSSGRTLQSDMSYYPWCSSNEYDWHLIAAAPDLLFAAQLAEGVLSRQNEREVSTVSAADALLRLRRAIANATGAPV